MEGSVVTKMPARECKSHDGLTGAPCQKINGHMGDHGGIDPTSGAWHAWMI